MILVLESLVPAYIFLKKHSQMLIWKNDGYIRRLDYKAYRNEKRHLLDDDKPACTMGVEAAKQAIRDANITRMILI